MTKLELNILGCGSATPTLRHSPSCQVLNVRDNLMMIDCGEGSQLMMRRMKLKFSRLSHIFISHLHGDHCFGLPGLISTMALHEKTGSVTIHTFAEGAEWIQATIRQFCHELPFEVKFNVIKTGTHLIYEDNAITVTTIPLRHRVPTVGFLFREKPKLRHIRPDMTAYYDVPHWQINALRCGEDFVTSSGQVIANSVLTTEPEPCRSYAYCSDTMMSSRVIQAVKDIDWLYHEATYAEAEAALAERYGHSTARQAALVAKAAHAHRLLIGHFSSRYEDERLLLKEAQEVFPNTLLALEGLQLSP